MSAADWLSQKHIKISHNFPPVVIQFFSVVEIPTENSLLINHSSNSKTYASMVILMQLIAGSLCLLSAAFTGDNKKEKSYNIFLSYAITSVFSFSGGNQ